MTLRLKRVQIISIHAPVKGATDCTSSNVKTRLDFNPRSREGSDFLLAAGISL